ncbi:MAG TPA: AAA family ATPase [Microbacterium sp.]|nr:AAA family ATPase [Microbacterium sp.]
MIGGTSRAPMIGRDAELGRLREAFAAGRGGDPAIVVLRGEAGIGKTRIVQELLTEAAAARGGPPVVVATGQCIDIGEIGAAYTPVRRLLRELRRGVGDEAFRAAAARSVLASLSALLPDLGPEPAGAPRGADILAEAVEQVVEELSRTLHLVLVIEDLHWADAATIALLRTLAVTLRGEHVTTVLTYRSDDVGRGHPLRPLIAELERNRSVAMVDLQRLKRDDTAVLVTELGAAVSGEEIDELIARSDGVPFFVEELVALGGAELPDTLRDLVLARVERLSPDAREAMSALAAGGVRVPHDLLETVAGVDSGTLTRGLREALAAQVIVADGDGYAFRHALIQETVHDELLPSERAALHARYADALDAGLAAAPELAAEVAEHRMQARDVPRAFDATVSAYAHAKASAAPAAAVRLGERLLELWPQVGDADARAGTGRVELAIEIGGQWRDLSEAARGLRIAREARTWVDDDDVLARAALHLLAFISLSNLTRHHESLQEARAGIALIEGRDDAASLATHARLLSGLAAAATSDLAPSEDRRELGRRALALAERSGDEQAVASAASHFAWAASDAGDLEAALNSVRRITTLPSDNPAVANAALFESDILVRLGRYDEAIAAGTVGIQRATRIGLERGIGAMIAANVGEAHAAKGDVTSTLGVLGRAGAHLTTTPPFQSFTVRIRAQALSWDDRGEQAAQLRRDAHGFLDVVLAEDPEEQIGWAEVDAELALNRLESEPDSAARTQLLADAIERAATLGEGTFTQDSGLSRRILPAAARAVATAAQDARDAASATALRADVDRLVAALRRDAPSTAYRALVQAEWARAEGPDPDAWRAAAEVAGEGFIPHRYRHYARFRLAEALIAAGRRDEAEALATEIVADARAQGAAVVARWAQQLASRANMRIAGMDAAPAALREASVSALTPRERQVLALVAQGLTNPEIGRRLFISPKTASVHVSAILAKVGAANRAEAAAIYAALGDPHQS